MFQEQFWKSRIQGDIHYLKKTVSKLGRYVRRQIKDTKNLKQFFKMHRVKKKGKC